jgi:1,2-dihydroxy-3-keto-5-methylthiopentene dioxygenase
LFLGETMAILRIDDGKVVTDPQAIAQELAPLKVQLSYWPIDNPQVQDLLDRAALDDAEKEQVLVGLDHYFETLASNGYTSRDLIVLHPDVPNLDTLLSKFNAVHTHGDDEVRYIVEGEGVFGFVRPDGSQVELTMQPQEFINVPAGTEHWFYLTPSRRVKAVRYFMGMEGWVPEYTNTAIKFRQTAGV